MEYEELKSLWVEYDNKLEKLEKMNKKILFESLSRKPRRMIKFLKFKCFQSIITYPIVLFLVVYSNCVTGSVGVKLIMGCGFSLIVLVYLIYANLKTYSALHALNLEEDTVIEATKKNCEVNNIYGLRKRNSLFSLPILFVGIVFIYWENQQFSTSTIVLLLAILLILFFYNLKGSTTHKNMLKKLEKDIIELNEYCK